MEEMKAAYPLSYFAKPLIDSYVKPKLESILKKQKIDKQISEHSINNAFGEYIVNAYEYYSILNSIVFENQQIDIDKLFIPLTIQPDNNEIESQELYINEYNDEFIPKYKKVLVVDSAGMGKSTLLKWLFLSAIKKNAGIPIFIELRKLSKETPIINFICNELNSINDCFDQEFILNLIKRGDFIFFLDGYDEIPFTERKSVLTDIQNFIYKAKDNLFILSSRPEDSIGSFSQFQKFKIRPLEKKEAYKLIEKYDSNTNSQIAKHLINKLEEDINLANLHEFLTNPMMVALLYKSFEHKPIIPTKKPTFFRQVYDAFFEKHDLKKGDYFKREKKSKLETEDFHQTLRGLGFFTAKLGKLEFCKDELIKLLSDVKAKLPNLRFNEDDFIYDIIISIPLFEQLGEYYKWKHKSFQEYFAAQYIWKDAQKKDKIIDYISHDDNIRYFKNLLDLYYDMDYTTFRYRIILPLIDNFINYCNHNYSNRDIYNINENLIKERQGVTYGREYLIIKRENDMHTHELDGNVMIKKHFPKNKYNSLKLSLTRSTPSQILHVATYPFFPLIDILASKNEQIFLEKRTDNSSIKLPLDKMGEITYIDDDPNSILNSKEYFEKVNFLLLGIRFFENLDINKCLDLKKKIQEEINLEDDLY